MDGTPNSHCLHFDDVLNGVILEKNFEGEVSVMISNVLERENGLCASLGDLTAEVTWSIAAAIYVGEKQCQQLVEELVSGRELEESVDGEIVELCINSVIPVR